MTTFTNILIMICGLIAILAAMGLGMALQKRGQRLADMEKRIGALEEKAEHAPKRLANRTIAGIEDAQAILIDLVFTHEAEEARLNNLRDVLSILRRDPNQYDPERPAGLRKEV